MIGKPPLTGDVDNMVVIEDESKAGVESRWRAVFEGSILPTIMLEFKDHDAQTKQAMEGGMNRIFEDPYATEMSLVAKAVGDKEVGAFTFGEVDPERARQIFFLPWPSDMRLYPQVFLLKTDASEEKEMKRRRGLKYKLLSIFYTLHGKDNTLLERFVHHGGLEALASLLLDDNNIIQSQAVEILHRVVMLNPVQVGSPTRIRNVMDFLMQTPPDAGNPRLLHLMGRLHSCLVGDTLFPALQRILIAPDEVFPNSHVDSLKLLATGLNWLHRGPEQLGREDVNPSRPLRGAGKSTVDLRAGVQSFLDGNFGLKHPECQEMAETMIAGGAPLLEAGSAADPASDPFTQLLDPGAREACRSALFAPAALEAEDARFASLLLKNTGATAFKLGKLPCALDCYRLACPFASRLFSAEAPGLPVPGNAEAERRGLVATLRSNEAAVLLKQERWSEAFLAASAAAEADPEMPKAHYRKAEAMLRMAKASSSLRPWREADVFAGRALELLPGDKAVAALRERAGQELEAAIGRGLPEGLEEELKQPAAAAAEPMPAAAMDEMD